MHDTESGKKKLLAITWTLPYPLYTGYSMRVFHMLKNLSSSYDITLVCFYNGHDSNALKTVHSFCNKIVHIPIGNTKKILNSIYYFFSSVPLKSGAYSSKRMQGSINEILDEGVDLIYVSDLRMASYVSNIKSVPKVLDAIDYWLVHYQKRIKKGSFRLRTFYEISEYIKMKDYEPYIISKFDLVLLVSAVEKDLLSKECPYTDFAVVPVGFDPDYMKPSCPIKEPNSLLFTGNLSYPPNEEAALYFKKKIFPKIHKAIPGVHTYIVGANPKQRWLKKMISPDIRVVTNEKDIRPYFNRCQVFVAPILTGSGMRFKLVEAMAMGVPVITTSLGAEGLKIVDGVNAVLANSTDSFAEAVIQLLKNPKKAAEIGNNARSIVLKTYVWKNIVKNLEKHLNMLIQRSDLSPKIAESRRKVA